MEKTTTHKAPIINCHTHIFTSDHVPPYLAKKFLFWPAYLLLHLGFIVSILKWWFEMPGSIKYKDGYKRFQKVQLAIRFFLNSLGVIYQLVGWFLTLQTFFILYDFLRAIIAPTGDGIGWIESIRAFLSKYNLLYTGNKWYIEWAIILFILFFFKWGRNFIIFIFKKLWKFLGMLPGKQTYDLIKRYINIARYSAHVRQTTVFGKLRDQYPQGTGFIVLPMDMEFMDAGETKASYSEQMDELADIKEKNKKTFFPFVFVDPRRLEKEKAGFFGYTIGADGKQILDKDCFVKQFIEDKKFSGFKIYPALGYYPFDELLLPVWKYAADNQIPIMTHCIRGTIFYRGNKKSRWNKHEVFKQSFNGGFDQSLLLPEIENEKFSWNFTHPMNFLCLLKEELLRQLVSKAGPAIKLLFGYTDLQTPLKHDLSKLKICFGHFGGDDQWKLFLERDRDNFSSELLEHPDHGIEFFTSRTDGQPIPGKIEQVWKYTDWYSVICSLMLQYDNVYSDISYIVHDNDIQPLLKSTLQEQNKKLRSRVLFGTDFYVVRNHKSERNMLVDSLAGLTEHEFDLIARINPREYLYNRIHGHVSI